MVAAERRVGSVPPVKEMPDTVEWQLKSLLRERLRVLHGAEAGDFGVAGVLAEV